MLGIIGSVSKAKRTTLAKKCEVATFESAWQQRVRMEKVQLDEKLGRLRIFVASPTFKAIDKEQGKLLMQQVGLMEQYSNVLGIRLDLFAKK